MTSLSLNSICKASVNKDLQQYSAFVFVQVASSFDIFGFWLIIALFFVRKRTLFNILNCLELH